MRTPDDDLKLTFDLATLRNEAKYLRKDTDWRKASDIKDHYKKARQTEVKRYYDEYDKRFNQAMKECMNKRGAKDRKLTHRIFGIDQFNKAQLARDANRAVQYDHHRRMMQLKQSEAKELHTVIQSAKQNQQIEKEFNRDFVQRQDQDRRQTPDRRQNPDRRQQSDRRQSAPRQITHERD